MKKLRFFMLFFVLLFGYMGSLSVYAAEGIILEENFGPGEESWETLDQFLEEHYGNSGQKIRFSDLMKVLLEGNAKEAGTMLVQAGRQALFQEIANGSHIAGQILALAVVGAMFTGFSDMFAVGMLSETGLFMTYLAAFSVMAVSVFDSASIAAEVLQQQISFMQVLVPSYFLAAAWTGAGVTAAAWHELCLLLITAIQWLYRTLLLPLIRIYILISMCANMIKEDLFSKMTECLKGAVVWGTRSLLALVLGFQMIQGMVLPYADAVKTAGTQKLLQAIPGIGQGTEAVTKMVLGSAVLIKNTMGAAAALILILISLLPVAKLTVLLWIYRGLAAVIQPAADKRLTACISSIAEGQKMMLGLVCSALCLFLLTIALICVGTNVSYLV